MTSNAAAVPARSEHRSLRTPVAWGVVLGVLQAASPLAFFWLDAATVYALGLALIAAIYIGFAVADGRRHVLAGRRVGLRGRRRGRGDRNGPAGRRRPGRARRQGHVAAPHRLRGRRPLVAAVLRHRRLHGACGDIPPVEFEDNHYRSIAGLTEDIPAELSLH